MQLNHTGLWSAITRTIDANEKYISIISQITLGLVGIVVAIYAAIVAGRQATIMERQNSISESLLKLTVPPHLELKKALQKKEKLFQRYEPNTFNHYLFRNRGGPPFYLSGRTFEIVHLTLGRLGAQDRHYLILLDHPWRFQSAVNPNIEIEFARFKEYEEQYDSLAYIYQDADAMKVLHDYAFYYYSNQSGPWIPEFEIYGKYLLLEFRDINDKKYQRIYSLLPPYGNLSTQQLDSLVTQANGLNGHPISLKLTENDSLLVLSPFLNRIVQEGRNYSINGSWSGPQ